MLRTIRLHETCSCLFLSPVKLSLHLRLSPQPFALFILPPVSQLLQEAPKGPPKGPFKHETVQT